jgi:very-short-patch-repair endonuclease
MAKQEMESELERTFYCYWSTYYPLALPALQYRFHPSRKFRFDFAWPRSKLAVEIQGFGPGHFSLQGATADYDRHIEALKLNWKIIYLTSKHLDPRRISDICEEIASLLSINKTQTGYVPLARRRMHD